jgi:N-acetylglucosaminyldiphosphoundecaprenol N-acetyl-beta-D-mannosaminyltransferase
LEKMLNHVNVLGLDVTAATFKGAVDEVARWISAGERKYVCATGAHGVIESQTDEELRDIHNRAGMVTTDGMPLVWMCRALGAKHAERVYGPDLMRAVTAMSAERGFKQFYYGGDVGVADLLKEKLVSQHPKLQVAGTFTPPFRQLTSEEEERMIEEINAANPDIVWVGLSTPKQERWMATYRDRINAPVLIGVGAAFDFLSDRKSQAPLWMQRNGLEWLFRALSEPRRLGRRYAWIVPVFMFRGGMQIISNYLRGGATSTVKQ